MKEEIRTTNPDVMRQAFNISFKWLEDSGKQPTGEDAIMAIGLFMCDQFGVYGLARLQETIPHLMDAAQDAGFPTNPHIKESK